MRVLPMPRVGSCSAASWPPRGIACRIIVTIGLLLIVLLLFAPLKGTADESEEGSIVRVTPQPLGATRDFLLRLAHADDIRVISRGSGVNLGRDAFDFDAGTPVDNTEAAGDLFWQVLMFIASPHEEYLVPMNGARFAVIGRDDFESFDFFDFRGLSFSDNKLDAGEGSFSQVPEGTVVAGLTNEGRFTKFVILEYDAGPHIRWVTYQGSLDDFSLESRGRNRTAELGERHTGNAEVLAERPEAAARLQVAEASESRPAMFELQEAVADRQIIESPATHEPRSTIRPRLQVERNIRLSEQTDPATRKLTGFDTRVGIADFDFKRVATPDDADSRQPTNAPANAPVELLAGIRLAVPLSAADVMQLHRRVYPDENRDSGIYYYFPRAYRIAWDQGTGDGQGLGLRISYRQTTEDDTAGAVRMAVLLDARVDLGEVQLARQLLQAQSRRQGFEFRQLRPFPLAAPPLVSLVDGLQERFDLDPEQIAITALSNTLDRIELSWVTDPVTAANMRLTLREGFGINGTARFLPPNDDGPSPLIPVNIRVDSAETFGRFPFDRDARMVNETPFGLILTHLHALLIEEGRPVVYSWSLGDEALAPQARVMFDTRHLPEAVDERARLMWVGYRLDKRCERCVRETIDGTVIGNVWPDTAALTLRLLEPLAESGARLLEVQTRSRFFEPDDRALRDGPVLIFESDGETRTVEPVFLAERTPPDGGPDWPLFEYRVSAIMPNGEVIEGRNWLRARGERVFIGSHQLQQSTDGFGNLE